MNVKFQLACCVPRNALEKKGPVNLARIRGSFEAVQLVQRTRARALVAHLPRPAAWCAVMARLFGLKVPILAHVFNFPMLPRRVWRPLYTLAFSSIDRFVVHSTMEREVYSKIFGIPADKFDVVLWGVRPPEVTTPEAPLEAGNYVAAIGRFCRDYRTLVEAARRMPDVRFVLVMSSNNLHGLDLPPNVTVHTNLPFGSAMNVLLHSRFMVLPLSGSMVPAGHHTMVVAMHLGKAFVVTDSAGVRDYARDGENALTVRIGSVESIVAATRRLWNDPALCFELGDNGRRFAARECSEERIVEHFRAWLRSHGLGQSRRHSEFSATPATTDAGN